MNKHIIITRGLSGSGKTTWSKAYVNKHRNYVRIARDEIDFMLAEEGYSTDKEQLVFATRDFLISEILRSNFNLILDETYLVPSRIEELNRILVRYANWTGKKYDIEIRDFIDVPVEDCIKRDRNRHFHVGEQFIRDYHKKYIVPLLKSRGVTKWTI